MATEIENLQLWAAALEKFGQHLQNAYESAGADTAFLYVGLLSFAFDVLRRAGHHPRHDPDQETTPLRAATAFDALAERWRTGQAIDDAALDRIAGELERLTAAEVEEELAEREREDSERYKDAVDEALTWLKRNDIPLNDAAASLIAALITRNGNAWPQL